MKKNQASIDEEAVKFVRELFKIYLEERNFSLVISKFSSDITWIGTGAHEVCKSFEDALELIQSERSSWDGHFKILEQWYQAEPINETSCVVFGELKIVEDGLNTILLDMHSRFSMLCCRENGVLRLFHAHFSVANAAQEEDEFVHKTQVENYNTLLEEKLQERTKMLKDKSIELQTLTNNIYGGVQICANDEGYTMEYASEGFMKLIGYNAQELKESFNNRHVDLIVPEDLAKMKAEIAQQLTFENSFSVEYRMRRKNGEIVWVLDKGRVIFKEGASAKVQCILMDITIQKEQADSLAQKSFELETITNNIEAAIVCCMFEGMIVTFANDGLFRMIGYTREEFMAEKGNSLEALIHPNDREVVKKSYEQLFEKGSTTNLVSRLIKKDGSIACILSKGTILIDGEGKREFHGVLTDITEQKEQEEALKISEKRYEIAMQVSDITMFEYNILTKDLILFEKEANLYGVTTIIPDGVATFVKKEIIQPESAEAYLEMYRKICSGEPFAKCCVKTKNTDGTIHDFELSLTTVYDSAGKPVKAIGVRKNITEMRQLEKENEFGKSLVFKKDFICEADIGKDQLISVNERSAQGKGLFGTHTFSELIKNVAESSVAPEHQAMFIKSLSKKSITKAFENGEQMINFAYQTKNENGEYRWFESMVNAIRDDDTGNIIVRCYTVDIDEHKKKEQKALDEKRLYEAMLAKATMAYEVNISKNQAISGHESWADSFGIGKTNEYMALIQVFSVKAIFPEDRGVFMQAFAKENLLRSFYAGEREKSCQYRKKNKQGEWAWVNCTLHMYEEPETGEVKGYSYVEDIDKQKRAELELQYHADHDALTGFYNKATFEKLITDFLKTAEGEAHQHAFIMVDIDYFKSINDNFGHVFGDAVLSQTSAKIRALFREDDLIGRIGGDEFVVFMKNIYNKGIAITKAQEICDALEESFYQRGRAFKISASVGISLYRENGNSYYELYKHSDSALYMSKKNGRNQLTVYDKNMETVEFEAKEFDATDLLEAKTFESNISEYVFRILYESQDKEASIHAVLNLVGKQLNVSRAYIFEDSPNGEYTNNTYEWCNTGIEPQKEYLQNVPYSELSNYHRNFNEDGIFFMPDISRTSPDVRKILTPQKVKSMLQFSIVRYGKFCGFIGFDQCDYAREPSKREVSIYHNVAQILGVFIMEMRAYRRSEVMETIAASIVNSLNSYAYVCDPSNHEVLFINDRTLQIAPHAKIGEKCYEAFWGRSEPCEICPMKNLQRDGNCKCHVDVYNNNLNVWVKATASWVNWQGGYPVCLVDSVDITETKQEKPGKSAK